MSKRLSFRLVAGVWTLAAFIFVQAYTSTLFTYIMAPVNPPLINSMHGVAESTDINLLFRLGSTMNVFVMVRSDKWQDFAYLNLTHFYSIQKGSQFNGSIYETTKKRRLVP
jgi:hypothetical protein